MKVEMVLTDVGEGKNGAKVHVVQEYSLTRPSTKLKKRYLWVRRSCWVRSIELKFVVKAWAYKKIILMHVFSIAC